MAFKRSGELIIIMLCCIASSQNNKIETVETHALAAKTLTYDSFYTVTVDSPFDLLLGYRQPEAGCAVAVSTGQHHETVIHGTPGFLENLPVISSRQQTLLASKTLFYQRGN